MTSGKIEEAEGCGERGKILRGREEGITRENKGNRANQLSRLELFGSLKV